MPYFLWESNRSVWEGAAVQRSWLKTNPCVVSPLRGMQSFCVRALKRDFGISGVLSWHFEGYPLVPGCHTFLILHGVAETFGLNAEVA
jgi:hypothetical protein